METFFQEYVDRMGGLHQDIKDALKGLPQEAYDWVPGKDMNSLAVLVSHLTGTEDRFLGGMVGGIASSRVRDVDFQLKGADEAALSALLDESLAKVSSVCVKLTLKDLEAKRTRGDKSEVTVTWVLLHALDHTALHLGHIQITRQLWEQRK